ncbi:hypothetical protein DL93DRAFT_1054693 [Clavulina sp. PMI_390]|nr:hypothetical protein DL93DRAFT_1054693 [Clavulina sp. PMI_390]
MAFQPYSRSGGFGVTRPMSTMAGVQSTGALVNRISSAVGAFVGNSVGSIPGRFPGSGNTVVAPLPSVQIVAPGRASGSGLRNVKLESTPPAAAMMATKPRSGSSLPSTQTQPKLGFRSASTPSSAPTSNPASTRGTRLHYIKTESSTSSETIDLSIESDDDEPVIVQVVRGPSSGQSAQQPPKNAASSGNSAGASVPKPAIAPPKPVAGQKRLGMRGPLKPFGAPKEKRVRTE